jgi:signal transduction histidine kinase
LTAEISVWLKDRAEELVASTIYRAPNMLPDERDVAAFISVLAEHVGTTADRQLTAMQSWAVTTIGRDAITAGDWLTILRVLKEEIENGLSAHFSTAATLAHWKEVDHLLTIAVIEAAKLTSSMGQADLLAHTVELREELERLEQSKSNFITVAAHELKTPLTIMEGYARMLRSELEAGSPLQLYLSGMDNGLVRMQEIIGDMIDVSLIDLHSFELSYQQVSLANIISMVAANLQKHFDQRKVELNVKPFALYQPTYADPQRLAKAFEKLLLNALKYTPDGGRVTVSGRAVRESDAAGDIAGFVDIEIRDSGIGIDPANLERIFDKFSSLNDPRYHSSSKTAFKGGGAGLGLPISKGIVEAHGGRIYAESTGRDEAHYPGSTFHIELPIYLSAPVGVDVRYDGQGWR